MSACTHPRGGSNEKQQQKIVNHGDGDKAQLRLNKTSNERDTKLSSQ